MTGSGRLIVLGVDPGLSITGYGLVLAEDNRYQAIDFGVVALPASLPHPERLLQIHDTLAGIIRDRCPDEVAVEDFIVGHVRAAVALGQARAAALLAAARAGLPVSLYKPLEVKRFVTSYGRGSKEQVQAMVQTLLGLDSLPRPPDAADALAVALCHCLRRNSALPNNPSAKAPRWGARWGFKGGAEACPERSRRGQSPFAGVLEPALSLPKGVSPKSNKKRAGGRDHHKKGGEEGVTPA